MNTEGSIFNEFIEKLKNLQDNEVLKAGFGLAYFEAGRFTKDMPKKYYDINKPPYEFYIKETKYLMYKSKTMLSFTTSKSLESQLLGVEMFQAWYAKNVYTGHIQFLDNYINFLKSFK